MTTYFLTDTSPGHKATEEVMELFNITASDCDRAALLLQHHVDMLPAPRVTTCLMWQQDGQSREKSTTELGEAIGSRKGIERAIRLNIYKLLADWTGQDPSPWGILRGVRPTKIAHLLSEQGKNSLEIINTLQERFHVHQEEAALVTAIAARQESILQENTSKKISIYIGIPFCPSRCFYCSFPGLILPEQNQVDRFLEALYRDMDDALQLIKQNELIVENIYVGGGTPTSLSASDLDTLLGGIEARFLQKDTQEFTLEAGRPDSITVDKINRIAASKVTRVSVNPQSMQQKTLKRIGRNHTIQDIIDIFMKFRKTSCLINMDMITGLPGETVADVQDTLRQIAELAPDNLTVHTLAVKRGAALKESLDQGDIAIKQALPDPSIVRQQVAAAAQAAAQMGMVPYYLYRQKNMAAQLHNVGYAKAENFCRYNVQMMEQRHTIFGIGPGAATKAVVHGSFRLDSCYQPKDLATYQNHLERYLDKRRSLLNDLYAGKLFCE